MGGSPTHDGEACHEWGTRMFWLGQPDGVMVVRGGVTIW
jgi:hypothetical protein